MITIEQHNQIFTPATLSSISETAEIYIDAALLRLPSTPSIEFLQELDAELSRLVRPEDIPAFVDFITEVNGFYLLTSDEAGARVSEFIDSYQGWFESERAFAEYYCDVIGRFDDLPDTFPRAYIDFNMVAHDLFLGDFTRTSRGHVFYIF